MFKPYLSLTATRSGDCIHCGLPLIQCEVFMLFLPTGPMPVDLYQAYQEKLITTSQNWKNETLIHKNCKEDLITKPTLQLVKT